MKIKVMKLDNRSWLVISILFLLTAAIVVALIFGLVRNDKGFAEVANDITQQQINQVINQNATLPPLVAVIPQQFTSPIARLQQAVTIPVEKTIDVTIRPRDTLSRIWKRNSLDPDGIKSLLTFKTAAELRKLRVGQKISFLIDNDTNQVKQITYAMSDLDTLVAVATTNKYWSAKTTHVEPQIHIEYAGAVIKGSINSTAIKIGVSRKVLAQFIRIFSSKVNFKKIHAGDQFALFYKRYIVNDKVIREGDIVAGEIIHDQQISRLIGFTDPSGDTDYYTPDGYNLKPPFVRYPVKFTHIGSRFSLARLHPILGIVRAHLGVDLAAPYGTPIRAASSGKVAVAGREPGYGNVVIIEHGKYSTLYAHLSRFERKIFEKRTVKQGQVIGYVGATGLATAPHLHYEFRINGVHYDPLTVKLPQGELIAAEYRKQFFAFAKQMLTKLELRRNDRTMLALGSG